MSKRRVPKIKHKVPEPRSAVLTPEYQAEVDRSMERGRLRWESEQAALAKVERRRARLAARKPKTAREAKITKRQLAELDAQIELYRMHLQHLQRMMMPSGASAAHRGRDSYRPVPQPGDLL